MWGIGVTESNNVAPFGRIYVQIDLGEDYPVDNKEYSRHTLLGVNGPFFKFSLNCG